MCCIVLVVKIFQLTPKTECHTDAVDACVHFVGLTSPNDAALSRQQNDIGTGWPLTTAV